ncbi:MAG: endonuclease domain-containing protein [Fimbriimonas sp.]
MRKGANNRSDKARDRARELRRNMGVSESILWELLRNRASAYKFRRQHPVGPYFLDFFCREASLAIELDGEQHADQVAYDARRDAWLASQGILVIRIPTLDLFEETKTKGTKWIQAIEAACAERTPSPHPQPPLP